MAWTDEQRDEAKELYLNAKPTPDNTTEIVKDVAETMNQTPNGVRMILNKMKDKDGNSIYIKAAAAKTPSKASGNGSDSDKPKRVSKADTQEALIKALEALGFAMSDDEKTMFGRMTGKAMQFFADKFTELNVEEEEDDD